MRTKLFAVFLALTMALTAVAPAGAITGGQPDGDRHPYGALLLVPGVTFCSGTLIDENVVLTADTVMNVKGGGELGMGNGDRRGRRI